LLLEATFISGEQLVLLSNDVPDIGGLLLAVDVGLVEPLRLLAIKGGEVGLSGRQGGTQCVLEFIGHFFYLVTVQLGRKPCIAG
jgi:hypothetical protein